MMSLKEDTQEDETDDELGKEEFFFDFSPRFFFNVYNPFYDRNLNKISFIRFSNFRMKIFVFQIKKRKSIKKVE